MFYDNVVAAKFLSRPNRFIAVVRLDGREIRVHVKNTGRCKELLVPGVTVYLTPGKNPARRTPYDLIAVNKDGKLLINMDSMAANDVAEEWLKSGALFPKNAKIQREVTHGNSRFDFYIENGVEKTFLEVKGVTLENDGIAAFPDAPTERGVKHLRELAECIHQGYKASVLFVIQMPGMKCMKPNDAMHPEFGDALRDAARAGVNVMAYGCKVTPDTLFITKSVPVVLEKG